MVKKSPKNAYIGLGAIFNKFFASKSGKSKYFSKYFFFLSQNFYFASIDVYSYMNKDKKNYLRRGH